MHAFPLLLSVASLCWTSTGAIPVSQPVEEPEVQYYLVPQRYQNEQPQYISVPPVPGAPTPIYEASAHRQSAPQPQPPQPPTQRVSQLLLPSAADRQVQKAAEQLAGPNYRQQIQFAQQQGLANEVIATAQRRAQHQLRRAQQQAQQAQQAHQNAQQQQYLTEVGPRQQLQQPTQEYVQVQVPQQRYQLAYNQQDYQSGKPVRTLPTKYQAEQSQQKEEEEHDNNSSYQFGFAVKDDQYTNYQNRKEQREGGKISGSYSVVDSDGYIRTVTYTADPKEGFKAEVVREPTDIVVKIPQPKEQKQYPQYIQEAPVQKYRYVEQPQGQQQKQNLVYEFQ